MFNLTDSEKRLAKLVLQNEALRHYNEYLKKVENFTTEKNAPKMVTWNYQTSTMNLPTKLKRYWRNTNNDNLITAHTQRLTHA